MKLASFDIGGTSLKAGVVNSDGNIQEMETIQIHNSDGDQVLESILKWIKSRSECKAISISAPGYVNPYTGFIKMGGAIRKFDNFDMKNFLEEKTGLPVSVENDANCVLLSERWIGRAKEMNDFIVMTIGTGIGGAVWCNNKILHGSSYRAGEFGYMQTSRSGMTSPLNNSMNENCTLRVLRIRYAELTGAELDKVSGEEIFNLYDSGDPLCSRLVCEFLNDICSGIFNLANIFDPEMIFLGGGITERPGFLSLIKRHLTWYGLSDVVSLVSNGNQSGLIGAVRHFNNNQGKI